ncbi:hypothetical protein J2S48_003937 [Promicromonospora iranensis]|uniref:Uncharacterized protein n=1 Tax=Promicromonospora iranensis TaxID=1105144 RepID=A0ABU2CTF0_9MICO|nr:hypothetical protein [Promicromonospora iranensis]
MTSLAEAITGGLTPERSARSTTSDVMYRPD